MKNKKKPTLCHYPNGVVFNGLNRKISILKAGDSGKDSRITLVKYHDQKINKEGYKDVITIFRGRVSVLNFLLDEEALIQLYDTITGVLVDKGLLERKLERKEDALGSIIQAVIKTISKHEQTTL